MLLKPGVENMEYWFMFKGIDKLLHLCIFAFLGFSLLISFKNLKFKHLLVVIVIYGLATEILQEEMHLGRSFEFLDLCADILGSSIGYIIYKKFKKYFLA